MKFRKSIKIKFSEKVLPKTMFAIASDSANSYVPEIIGSSQDFRESYLMLFYTEKEAQGYINKQNKKDWFRARNNHPVRINTTLKRFKSRYVPLQYAFNKLFSG